MPFGAIFSAFFDQLGASSYRRTEKVIEHIDLTFLTILSQI